MQAETHALKDIL